jgi:hypothetical protein
MTKIANKRLVENFFDYFVKPDVDGALSLLTKNAKWRVMGQQGGLPISGEMDRQGIAVLMNDIKELMSERLQLIATGWTIEDNRVAVEITSNATMKNGKKYHNLYHFLIVISDDKIETIREYMDTDQVKRVFLDS